MNIKVRVTTSFQVAVKPLLKKYKSLADDLQYLEASLEANPKLGISLGNNTYKIRLKIKSKGKGKRGGARVITFVETTIIGITQVNSDDKTTVYLLTIYDKSEVSNISDKEIKELISKIEL